MRYQHKAVPNFCEFCPQHPGLHLTGPGGCLGNVSQETFEETRVPELALAQITESGAHIPFVDSVHPRIASPV